MSMRISFRGSDVLRLLVTTTFAELSLFHSTSETGSDVGNSLGCCRRIPAGHRADLQHANQPLETPLFHDAAMVTSRPCPHPGDLMRTTRATLALATILILAGCSQTSPSSAGSAAATATGSGPAAAATSSSGGGASASASTTPSIPAGHQAVTAPTSGLTFAIPEDWEDLNALPEAQKALLARAQGVDCLLYTSDAADE